MISIIVCSRNEADYRHLQENIQATVGTACEWIRIDNSRGGYDIFTAYDEGMRRSTGDLLCFVHEDIRFHSPDWGKRCEEYFKEDARLGLLGVLGGNYMPVDADWRAFHDCRCGRMLQRAATLEVPSRHFTFRLGTRKSKHELTAVAAVDGMWMVMPATLKNRIHLDTKRFSAFDLYDTDLAMQVHASGYRVAVAGDILIEHFSTGSFSPRYFDSLKICLDKWKDILPVDCRPIPTQTDHAASMQNFRAMKSAELSVRGKLAQGIQDYTPDEIAVIRTGILLFHHIYEKNAPHIADSLREIDKSLSDGWITSAEAQTFRWKTWLYHSLFKAFSHD